MTEADSCHKPGSSRKKFAVPPVKVACLACRASRTRCNGERPACASCTAKDRQCVYKPSRRGGPRFRKKVEPVDGFHEQEAAYPTVTPDVRPHLAVERYIEPGAGLKNLGDTMNDSDALFDSLFMSIPSDGSTADAASAHESSDDPMVRTYCNDAAILNAYYIWIHPFFPILPPPASSSAPDEPIPYFQNRPADIDESSSPVALALSAILALIPCPQDGNSLAEGSTLFRRNYAQFVAQAAIESIENESERPESAVEPRKALDEPDELPRRSPFHVGVPLDLEGIIALDLLSVYEYAQRGNLKKMKNRASTAMMYAMNLSLHIHNEAEDEYLEARRRVWWMTYVCVCQASIVSNTQPSFEVFAPSFSTKFPSFKSDREAWPWFIKSQQAILSATQFVIELNKAMANQADMTPSYRRMMELESLFESLIDESEKWALNCPMTQPVDSFESVAAHSLRCMSRIKLNSARIKVHRYCAFFDMPIFTGKYCDLKPATEHETRSPTPDLSVWPTCCNALLSSPPGPACNSTTTPTSTVLSHSSPGSTGDQDQQSPLALIFPFSSHQSAKICLKSALNIAQAFDSLPYPNPSGQLCDPPCFLGPRSNVIAPKTMPSFACCAMQCAYVLLSVYNKTQTAYPEAGGNPGSVLVSDLLSRLQQGLLSTLATLENYGTAFEALGGMRDQIRDKVYSSLHF